MPDDEARRLASLRELLVLDTAPEALFDRLATLASEICGAPIALLSLVDEERQWFKANIGMPGIDETPRDIAFCAHAIGSPETMVVPDAAHDPRFADNPLVTGPPDIRFYAGAPLVLRDGARIGTLCVIDRQPRDLDPAHASMLRALAALASIALELRRELIQQAIASRTEREREIAASEARYRAIVEGQAELVCLARENGELILANPAAARHFAREADTLPGSDLFEMVAASDRDRMRRVVGMLFMDGARQSVEFRSVLADGTEAWIAWNLSLPGGIDGERLLLAVGRDVTASRRTLQAQARQGAVLQSVTDAIPALVGVIGTDLRYRFVNAGLERWLGLPRERIIGRTAEEVLGAHEYERSRTWVERALGGEPVGFDKAFPDRPGNPHLSVSIIPLRDDEGTVDGLVAVAQDITRHKREADRLLQLSQTDALTGLLNRAGFDDFLERQIEYGDPPSLALLYIDLDHFKDVNDRHGHAVGDQLLQAFARRVQHLVRPSDAVARLGGDEFAIVLVGLRDPAPARAVADKVLVTARGPFHLGEAELEIGASIGVAYGLSAGAGGADLVARADARLYEAKQTGRNRQVGGDDA